MAGKKLTYDLLGELRASASQAVGTENGTALDIGPTGIVKVVESVTVVGASGTLTSKVQGSSDNSTFYDIPGGSFLDPTDGAVIDSVGQYEIFIKTDFRYVRLVSVVATAAITHAAHIALAV